MNRAFKIYFNVHLVSDSTGETLSAVMRACFARFESAAPLEHSYYLVRSTKQLDRVLIEIENSPGVVMFTISNPELREALESACRKLNMPCVAVLDPVQNVLSRYLGLELSEKTAAQRVMDAEYFRRIDALNYAMAHDDGQLAPDLEEADVILVGVSRTSKTPTSIYLANRGMRTANVPIVPNVPLPEKLFTVTKPLIVGLKISPDRLAQVRRHRLLSLKENPTTDYADEERIREEVLASLRLFERHGWPVIDVTRRSIEETAAAILNLLNERRGL